MKKTIAAILLALIPTVGMALPADQKILAELRNLSCRMLGDGLNGADPGQAEFQEILGIYEIGPKQWDVVASYDQNGKKNLWSSLPRSGSVTLIQFTDGRWMLRCTGAALTYSVRIFD
ncbi:MAG: hypothetical protein KGZ72_06205 [Roseovarius sp.]|jgi:hypothetical protein|nr:hypothetical protein [Roseovarius sp.]